MPVSFSYADDVSSLSQEVIFDLDVVMASPVAFQSLEQMDELVQLGVPGLALRMLTHEQKKWPIYSADWYAFERKHISLLAALDDWQKVVDRIETLLTQAIPSRQIEIKMYQWFSTQQVIAQLSLGQAEKALSQLRSLLWNASKTGETLKDSDIIALWRRLVIRAYLAMNANTDVQKSLLRYQHDYIKNNQNLNLDILIGLH